MALVVEAAGIPSGLAKLTFDRTLDRRLLHRDALSEVFLTDSARVDDSCYLVGAQVPPTHPYYTDHAQLRVIDPLLLMECARQAETYGGHAHFDVPFGTSFVLRRWSLALRGIGAEWNQRPTALQMAVHTRNPRYVNGRLRDVIYEVHLFLGTTHIGEVRIDVAYLPKEAYRAARVRRRGGTLPPTSADLPVSRWSSVASIAPHRVGRFSAANVVLYEPVVHKEEVEAVIRIPIGNPSMFDHPQDHLPGMVMMEAARQLGIVVLGTDCGLTPREVFLVGFEASFSNYAELDEPTIIRAERDGGAGDGGTNLDLADGHRKRLRITFHQRGETIAESTLTFAMARDA